jgi:hypothetical protein
MKLTAVSAGKYQIVEFPLQVKYYWTCGDDGCCEGWQDDRLTRDMIGGDIIDVIEINGDYYIDGPCHVYGSDYEGFAEERYRLYNTYSPSELVPIE